MTAGEVLAIAFCALVCLGVAYSVERWKNGGDE